MATAFCFEHVFRAPSVEAVFAAYFDPDHLVVQDRELAIRSRELLALVDHGPTLERTCRVVPERQLPAILRPFLRELSYIETATWRRGDDEIDVEIRPSLLGGKPVIRALYRLSRVSDGGIHRRYAGTVSVETALFAMRIERGIVAEFERSMPVAAKCTQAFLDRSTWSVSAQA